MPSLAVMGVRDGRELSDAEMDEVFVFKSSLRGRCLELACNEEGDEGGSFFTVILGALMLLPLSG